MGKHKLLSLDNHKYKTTFKSTTKIVFWFSTQIACHALQENIRRGSHGPGIPEGSEGDASSVSGLHLPDEPANFRFVNPQECGKLSFNFPSKREGGDEGKEKDDVEDDNMEETERDDPGAVREAVKMSVSADQVGMMDHLWASIVKLGSTIEAVHARLCSVEEDIGDTCSDLINNHDIGDLSEGVVRALSLLSPTAAATPELEEITKKISDLAEMITAVDEDHQKAGRFLLSKLNSHIPVAPCVAAAGPGGSGQFNLSMAIINNVGDQVGILGQLLKSLERVTDENGRLKTQVESLSAEVSSQGGMVLDGLVGTLQDGYVRNVPLPRVPREQRASPELTAPEARIPLPGYSRLPAWIPTLPKIGNVFGFSQRLL